MKSNMKWDQLVFFSSFFSASDEWEGKIEQLKKWKRVENIKKLKSGREMMLSEEKNIFYCFLESAWRTQRLV